MKEKPAIEIKNLSKVYNLYRHPSDILKEIIFRRPFHEEFSALKKINLSVRKGEVVGIIGRNGSGKSTLLKILAGSLDKTSGHLKVNGKISAILELGLGFNPEYSGRQNIYNGALVLGMSKREIDAKMQSIIDFSELGEFIDRPFKTYSTGMQARLTFAVASEIEPDILVIDEALAAGDMFFMAKCVDRMVAMCRSGATILIVSHSIFLIRRLCTRAILLKDGKILKDGSPEEVCSFYEMGLITEESENIKDNNLKKDRKVVGSGEVEVKKVELFDQSGKENYSFFQHDDLTVRISYETKKNIREAACYVLLSRDDGVLATSFFTGDPNYVKMGKLGKKGYVEFIWHNLLLGDGNYLVTVAFYPWMEGPDSIQKQMINPYVFCDKGWGFKLIRKKRPLQTMYDQKVEVVNRRSDEQ